MPKKVPLFYDANCFMHIPEKYLSEAMDIYDNKITSSVVNELHKHFIYSEEHPEHKKNIDLLFNSEGKVNEKFQIINLEPTIKNNTGIDNSQRSINLKENPIICSSYYNLLPNAYNPAAVLSPYDHTYNFMLYKINQEGKAPEEIADLERKLKNDESKLLTSLAQKSSILKAIDPIKLLRVKKKRSKEAKSGQTKLVDVQLIVSALLYSCYYGTRTCVLTNDLDLIDLTSSLILSILEKFTFYEALTREIDLENDITRQELQDKGELQRFIKYDVLRSDYVSLIKKCTNPVEPGDYFEFIILYYKADTGELIPDVHKIPIWLRDFIFEFKGNVDCYSLESKIEFKYPFKFTYDPSKSHQGLYFKVIPRVNPFYNGFLHDCEQRCIYSRTERENPKDISDFI